MKSMASALFGVLATVGGVPIIRALPGGPTQMISEQLSKVGTLTSILVAAVWRAPLLWPFVYSVVGRSFSSSPKQSGSEAKWVGIGVLSTIRCLLSSRLELVLGTSRRQVPHVNYRFSQRTPPATLLAVALMMH